MIFRDSTELENAWPVWGVMCGAVVGSRMTGRSPGHLRVKVLRFAIESVTHLFVTRHTAVKPWQKCLERWKKISQNEVRDRQTSYSVFQRLHPPFPHPSSLLPPLSSFSHSLTLLSSFPVLDLFPCCCCCCCHPFCRCQSFRKENLVTNGIETLLHPEICRPRHRKEGKRVQRAQVSNKMYLRVRRKKKRTQRWREEGKARESSRRVPEQTRQQKIETRRQTMRVTRG